MKNAHIKTKEIVPTELRLAIYKEALDINWSTNENGLCHILPMLLWGFSYPLDAHERLGHSYQSTKIMFPELGVHLSKIYIISDNEKCNLARIEVLKLMISELEK